MEGEKATKLTRELAPVPHALALQDIPLMTAFRKGAARLRPKLVHPSLAADWAALVSALLNPDVTSWAQTSSALTE